MKDESEHSTFVPPSLNISCSFLTGNFIFDYGIILNYCFEQIYKVIETLNTIDILKI